MPRGPASLSFYEISLSQCSVTARHTSEFVATSDKDRVKTLVGSDTSRGSRIVSRVTSGETVVSTNHVRLLYLPNEGKKNGKQIEGRTAFQTMLANGELQAYEVFSYWDELESGLSSAEVHEKLYQITCSFQPHILLWQHPTDFPVCTDTIMRIKSLNPSPLVVYDERDAYVWPQKSLPKGARNLARGCDVAFSSGLTTTGNLLVQAGARRVLYSPTAMDLVRFA